MKSPPSGPNHFPKALPPHTIALVVKISTYKFGGRDAFSLYYSVYHLSITGSQIIMNLVTQNNMYVLSPVSMGQESGHGLTRQTVKVSSRAGISSEAPLGKDLLSSSHGFLAELIS